MARYRITSLNYITSGDKKTLVNVDIQRPYDYVDPIHFLRQEEQLSAVVTEHGTGSFRNTEYIQKENSEALSPENIRDDVIFNEQQKWFVETNSAARKRLRMILSCCTDEMLEKMQAFNEKGNIRNVTLNMDKEHSKPDIPNSMNDTLPLYDMRDVCIRFKTPISNGRLGTSRENIYHPPFSDVPVGFCQIPYDQRTYMLSKETRYAPTYMYSTMNGDARYDPDAQYRMQLRGNEDTVTYIYNPAYRDVPHQEFDGLSAFTPRYALRGMKYNYISQIPTDELADNVNGDVLAGGMFPCKNMYDATYSMRMERQDGTDGRLTRCRSYCGICTDSDRMYLKYYDEVDYETLSGDDGFNRRVTAHDTTGNTDIHPYQKIEFVNTVSVQKTQIHKSNVFSIRLNDSTLIDTTDGNVVNIQNDIKNAIREIAKNICPADTQLFDVFFAGS